MKCPLVEMETVEIDPELFITCRLCLNEKGSYQITPVILEEIKFCFEIMIPPFDGLSQVICKFCKDILAHYSETKKKFKENHDKLLKLKAVGSTAEQNKTTSNSPSPTNQSIKTKLRQRKKKQKTKILSDDDDDTSSHKSEERILISETVSSVIVDNWKEKFQEYFVCRYCDKHCKSVELILAHLDIHKSLISQCHSLIPKNCNVRLNRIDNLPNITGDIDKFRILQLDPNMLILDQNDKNYYITYLPRSPINKCHVYDEVNGDLNLKRTSIVSSDSEDGCDRNKLTRRPLKRIRFLSSSSSTNDMDVTVIDENINQREDTFNSGHITVNNESNNPTDAVDHTTVKDCSESIKNMPSDPGTASILSLVLGSYNKYLKKLKPSRLKPDNDTLNRKVLSIGTKVMSKQGISSTGLLKYLDRKNLSISWIPSHSHWKDSDIVRVMTKVKDKPEIDTYECLSINKTDSKSVTTSTNNSVEKVNNAPNRGQILNANPVDNPKQAPKKKVICKFAPSDKAELCLNKKTYSELPSDTIICLNDSDEEVLPIVTSVTSLAPPSLNGYLRTVDVEVVSSDTNTVEPELSLQPSSPCTISTNTAPVASTSVTKEPPRIKCKPVTELMSSEALKNLVQNTDKEVSTASNRTDIILMPINSMTPTLLGNTGQAPSDSIQGLLNSGYITLDSETMHYTCTNSPFLYFEKLLIPFNIKLLPSEEKLDSSFHTLIKFRLELKQTVKSILLCLCLLGTGNMFSIKVQSTTKEYIRVHNMTASWQWEVLKAFQDDMVISRVLLYSKKNNVSDKTDMFMRVLKSIKKVL